MAAGFLRIFPFRLAPARAGSATRKLNLRPGLVATCAFAVLQLLLPDRALAESGGCSEKAPPVTTETESPEQQGLKVFIDPDTGELISEPAPSDAAQPPEAPPKAADQPELPVTERPDGTLVLDLSDNPVNELRVEKVDGNLIECHHEVAAPPAKSDAHTPGSETDHDN